MSDQPLENSDDQFDCLVARARAIDAHNQAVFDEAKAEGPAREEELRKVLWGWPVVLSRPFPPIYYPF